MSPVQGKPPPVQVFEIMTMTGTFDPRLAIEALRILTRVDQGGTLISSGSDKCRFDQLLTRNTDTLKQKLETDTEFSALKLSWTSETTVKIPPGCSPRWHFVLYCLKTLNLLQESFKISVAEYKKMKPESVRPIGAPPVSPDTLSFEEQKVVLMTVQFIVCLGISPSLDKGVGIPIEMRSEFSKLIQISSDEGEIGTQERQWRLYVCLKVMISCIFIPSLGSIILSRHLTDILAGLLQLIHSQGLHETEIETSRSDDKVMDNILGAHSDTAEIIKQSEKRADKTINRSCNHDESAGEADKVGTDFHDLSPASEMTPATMVDHVRRRFKEAEKTAFRSNQQNIEGDKHKVDVQINKEAENTAFQLNQQNIEGDKHKVDVQINNSGADTTSCNDITDQEDAVKVQEVDSGNSDKESFEPDRSEEWMQQTRIDPEFCENVLKDLIEKVYPPLLVKTLLLLQGGPRTKKPKSAKFMLPPAPVWLRKVCGEQLTVILMKPKGVQSVLRGMLDSPGQGQGMDQASDWRKCDAVAKVIASCPLQSLSVESYYKKIGPQILEILHIPDKQVAKQFLRVACSTIAIMWSQYPELTRQYVLQPLMGPLLKCMENTDQTSEASQKCIILDETQLSSCVEDCHRVLVSGSTGNPQLIQCLQPVILTLFQLLLFTKQGVSALKTACHELIVCYLKQTDLKLTLTGLELMAFQTSQKSDHDFLRMNPKYGFSHGSSGGVVVVYDIEREGSAQSQDVCVQCMVDLLKDLQNDGTAGEFLIHMLKELTAILRNEVEGNEEAVPMNSSSSGSDVFMKLESDYQSKEEQFYKKLMVLNLLASVCETLGPSCIKNTKNTLDFVKATLERAVQVCKATDDPVFEAFENETLTMAMGLLTAILTGAMEVTSDDRETMGNLLPLLQDISDNHPESSVQEMASDLRIAIATHGAVWSEVMSSNAEDFKELKSKIQQSVDTQKTASKQNPLVEVISETIDKTADKNTSQTESVYGKLDNRHINKGKGKEVNVKEGTKSDGLKTEHMNVKENDANLDKKGNKAAEDINVKKQKADGTEFETKELTSKMNARVLDTEELAVQTSETFKTEMKDKKSQDIKGEDKKSKHMKGELEEAFKELCDPLIPVRGHGLIRLTRLVQRRGKEAYDKKDTIMKIFEENLDHADSYMYLSSVNGLAAMAEIFPELVVPRICEQFANVGKDGRKRSSELRMKLGEILVKASRCLGDTIPKYRDLLINSVLTGAKESDGLVRASSLSNLGEICKLLHFSLGNIVHEVFLCCKSLLKSDSDPEVRKAAAVALTLLLQGLGQDILKVLDSVLLDLYRLLKQVMASEKDEGVRLHAHLALNELEDIMKDAIFLTQKLEKRIRVLDME